MVGTRIGRAFARPVALCPPYALLIAESGSLAAAGGRRTLRERAISLHCQMLGALVLSRSVAQTTPALSNEILENVKRDVLASLDGGSNHAAKPRKKHQGWDS
jgi:TetR/AcrR family transcriptional repressor of nem operon